MRAPCADGFVCDADGECIPAVTCSDNGPCLGYTCNTAESVCRAYCVGDFVGCADGYVCDNEGRCEAAVSCSGDEDCGGYICDNDDFCRVTCFRQRHCAQGYACRRGECVAN
jgi:hypothetical protein